MTLEKREKYLIHAIIFVCCESVGALLSFDLVRLSVFLACIATQIGGRYILWMRGGFFVYIAR